MVRRVQKVSLIRFTAAKRDKLQEGRTPVCECAKLNWGWRVEIRLAFVLRLCLWE